LPYKSSSYALAPNVRKQYLKIEQEINAGDHQILDLKEVKNNLEAYSYDMRSKIESYGDLEKYVDAQQKTDFLKQIGDVVEWLYDDASKNATKEELADRLAHFKAIGDPIK
jgi:molecular chaperone DnaK (HSP70)